MTAELTSVSALANELGWPRKRLYNYVSRRERELQEKDRPVQLLYGAGGKGTVYRVNRGQLEIHCPELFEPKPPDEAVRVLREHLRETTQWIEESQGELDEFRTELGAHYESVFATFQELRDLIDFQNYTIATLFQTVRSLEVWMRPNQPPVYAMDEGVDISSPAKSEEDETPNGATDGPTIPGCAQPAQAPRH